MTKKFTHSYFPKGIRYATPIPFAAGIYLFYIKAPIWAAVLVLLGVVILTTRYVTKISLTEKKYSDYLSLLGIKLDHDSKNFKSVKMIVVSKGNFSQKVVPPLGPDREINWSTYTGTLILDNDTLDLVTTTDKRELLLELKELTDFLNVRVEDRTTGVHHWVDMNKI